MASMNKPAADSTNWTTAYTDNWTSIENNLIDLSVVRARGDVLAASGASTPGRLPAGSDDQTLMADSTQSMGLKWASVPSAALIRSSTASAADSIAAPTNGFFDIPGMSLMVTVKAPGKVLILFNMHFITNGTRGVFKLVRDTTDLRVLTVEATSAGQHAASVMTLDSCGVGTFTFHAMWFQTYSNPWSGDARSLTVIPVPG